MSPCCFSFNRGASTGPPASPGIVIVYCSGFLDLTSSPFRGELPPGVELIVVQPCVVGSLHDRVCQIFWELKGGTVHYGQEHAALHGHEEAGRTFAVGKFPLWGDKRPVHLIGHSFGGNTVRALAAYLAQDYFIGHTTSAAWVVSVNTFSAPLNGCLRVYGLGASVGTAPVVRWGSPGCIVGWLVHIAAFLGLLGRSDGKKEERRDMQAGHWQLCGDVRHLLDALAGHAAFHSSTDNSAYDMTLHSAAAWAPLLALRADTFYSNVVSTSVAAAPLWLRMGYHLMNILLPKPPSSVLGHEVTQWADVISGNVGSDSEHGGYDGMLAASEQRGSVLDAARPDVVVPPLSESDGCLPAYGLLYTTEVACDHVSYSADAWAALLHSVQAFDAAHWATAGRRGAAASANTRKTISSDCSEAAATTAAQTKVSRPDMQLPCWSADDRPFAPAPALPKAAATALLLIATAVALALLVHTQQQLQPMDFRVARYFLSAVVGIMISPDAGTVEAAAAALRLLLLLCMLLTWPAASAATATEAYLGLLLTDAAVCFGLLLRGHGRDYAALVPKAIIVAAAAAAAIAETGNGQLPLQFWLAAASHDCATLLSKAAWALTLTLSRASLQSTNKAYRSFGAVWVFMVACAAALTHALARLQLPLPSAIRNGCGGTFSQMPLLLALRLAFTLATLEKVRDLSEAYQTFAIRCRYCDAGQQKKQ